MSIADFSGRVRPDACPGALQVHEAADGALARIRLPGGAISPAQLRTVAAGAADLGSGVIELTSRANVQVRGLRSPAAFAEGIAAAGLLPSAAHERVRNIVASPLGGRGRAGLLDTQPLVEALDRTLCALPRLAGLPGRFLFAVDDGTGDMPGLGADVTFVPGAAKGRLLLAGVDAGLAVGADVAVRRMIAAAEAFLDERESSGGERAAWRIGELADGPARIAARLGAAGDRATTPLPAVPAQRAGRIDQRDGRVALEAVVPLGRLSAAQARTIADVACDRVPIRFTPWRTIVLLDVPPAGADGVTRSLEAAGLVTDPASPWVGVSACTGRPGCAKSLADVQEDARRWVAALDSPPATPVHWAGCERRCGLPRGQVVQMIATGDGYQERQQ
ncbi:precorrin-3B synthase [Nonomuraea polychroma]|uniref:Precorrin-3B synthase n=1 Tax=Nonomuraea polychroma TaxID=46176 RepID=A0A438MLW9_9ACTN|nr:precorrin-3B synthase [Nonomuraea polychroma]RVX46758.1 precorrin-3B synthase [Nonomuraea polychroma]